MANLQNLLLRTKIGYSTGWTELTRNKFHVSGLHVIMTGNVGVVPLSMIHATELVSHYYHTREWCQPHINEQCSVNGFFSNIYPLMEKFKASIEKTNPKMTAYFKDMNESTATKCWLDACEKKLPNDDFEKYSQIIMEDLTRVFGEYVTISPSNDEAPNYFDSFLECFNPDKIIVI